MLVAKQRSYYVGHRQRAREKLLKFGADSLRDYEIVELMLFLIFKRKDVKPLAKMLIERFQTVDKILSAPLSELTKVDGIGKTSAEAIKIINGIFVSAVKSRLTKKKHLNCFEDVISYNGTVIENTETEIPATATISVTFTNVEDDSEYTIDETDFDFLEGIFVIDDVETVLDKDDTPVSFSAVTVLVIVIP